MTAVYQDEAVHNTSTYVVRFDGNKFRYDEEEPGVEPSCGVFNGNEVIVFDGDDTVTIDDPAGQLNAPLYFCDPRTLGIAPTYRIDQTVDNCVSYSGAKAVRMLGHETINGRDTSHIQVVDQYGQQRDFWIEQGEGFRVWRFDFFNGDSLRSTTLCSYHDSHAVLPSEVKTSYLDPVGKETASRHITVTEYSASVSFDDAVWTLEGMNIPVGTAVVDGRRKERLGYWDGHGLSDSTVGLREMVNDRRMPRYYLLVAGNIIVLAILLAIVGYRRNWWGRTGS